MVLAQFVAVPSVSSKRDSPRIKVPAAPATLTSWQERYTNRRSPLGIVAEVFRLNQIIHMENSSSGLCLID